MLRRPEAARFHIRADAEEEEAEGRVGSWCLSDESVASMVK